MSARALWLESRRRGIGGSDAAAILGLDPWRSSLDVWISKTQPREPDDDDEPDDDEKFHLRLGHLLEPVIAGLYELETKRDLYAPNPEILQHPKYPEILGSPDRLTKEPYSGRVVELKSEHMFADKFGDPGSDQVPDHYVIQACHYMAVAGIDRCDIAVLHGGFKFAIYQLRRDPELERSLIEQLCTWWTDYVVKGIEPALDGSEVWSDFLAAKYPFNRGKMVKVDATTDPNAMTIIENLFANMEQLAIAKKAIDFQRNILKAAIQDRDGLVGPWGKITWKRCKDSTATRINYDTVIERLKLGYGIPEETIERIREDCMESVVVKQGGRRFLAKRAKDLKFQIPETEQMELSE